MHVNVFSHVPSARFKLFVLTGVLMTGFLSLASIADAKTESFRRTCSEIKDSRVNGQRVITAYCERSRRSDGAIQIDGDARLVVPPEGCQDISNNEGVLQCNGAENPRGSWSQSCVAGRYIRGRLFQAICAPNGEDEPHFASVVDMNTCPSFNLDNINGDLRCH
jgi:hypothetical protein